jgi:hypothetical protein
MQTRRRRPVAPRLLSLSSSLCALSSATLVVSLEHNTDPVRRSRSSSDRGHAGQSPIALLMLLANILAIDGVYVFFQIGATATGCELSQCTFNHVTLTLFEIMRLRHNIDSNSLMRLMSYCSKIQGSHNKRIK